jgi:hypothetical protein
MVKPAGAAADPSKFFKKGNPGPGFKKKGGRPRGSQNKSLTTIREVCRRLLEDPTYRKALKERLRSGEAQALEILFYQYAYGKPKAQLPAELPVPRPIALVMRDMDKKDVMVLYEVAKRLKKQREDPDVVEVTATRLSLPTSSPAEA